MIKKLAKRLLSTLPEGRSLILNRRFLQPNPKAAKATIVLTVLTAGGESANGKVTPYRFLPAFCDVLQNNGFATLFASSERELNRRLSDNRATVVIHLYGEDHTKIASPAMDTLERRALAVYNGARTGEVLADKLTSHNIFKDGKVPVPKLQETTGFVRLRTGTKQPTCTVHESHAGVTDSKTHIRTEFIDTRVSFDRKSYFTTVRLLCIDDTVMHAYPRARDDREGNANVHASDTPLDSALIEFLHQELVAPRTSEFALIARQLFAVLGHGFYVHDLLIDRTNGNISVCESGFKFDDSAYWRHLEHISNELPSQAALFPVETFARHSAQEFANRCNALLLDSKYFGRKTP